MSAQQRPLAPVRDVTLLRIHPDGAPPNVATYAAARTSDAGALVEAGAGTQAVIIPWETLPGLRAIAAAELAGKPPRAVAMLGTTEAGQWATWHVPVDPPPVPDGD